MLSRQLGRGGAAKSSPVREFMWQLSRSCDVRKATMQFRLSECEKVIWKCRECREWIRGGKPSCLSEVQWHKIGYKTASCCPKVCMPRCENVINTLVEQAAGMGSVAAFERLSKLVGIADYCDLECGGISKEILQ